MANLYLDEQLAEVRSDASITVSGDEGRHAVRVSRLRVGERTVVGNGRGLTAEGVVESVDRDSFTVRVEHVVEHERVTPQIVLVQALAKGDRDERAVEQATEFGVDSIVPWQAERSVSRWDGDKGEKGRVKWARIAREASKQSLRSWVPEVRELVQLSTLVDLASQAHVIVLHPRGEARLSEWQLDDADSRDVYLVVGPEGGLSDRELDALEAAGAHIFVLGETVLRTSSAGPAALAVLNTQLGRW